MNKDSEIEEGESVDIDVGVEEVNVKVDMNVECGNVLVDPIFEQLWMPYSMICRIMLTVFISWLHLDTSGFKEE